jgi:hypothetical protein
VPTSTSDVPIRVTGSGPATARAANRGTGTPTCLQAPGGSAQLRLRARSRPGAVTCSKVASSTPKHRLQPAARPSCLLHQAGRGLRSSWRRVLQAPGRSRRGRAGQAEPCLRADRRQRCEEREGRNGPGRCRAPRTAAGTGLRPHPASAPATREKRRIGCFRRHVRDQRCKASIFALGEGRFDARCPNRITRTGRMLARFSRWRRAADRA